MKPDKSRKPKPENRLREYEIEKQRLQNLALTHEQYQDAIAKLIKRLGI